MSADLWVLLLAAMIQVESGGISQINHQEQAYGVLQIRQGALDDVNQSCGTRITLQDCLRNETISRWVCVQYARRYGAQTMEGIARTHNGGPAGPSKVSTRAYWNRVKRELRK